VPRGTVLRSLFVPYLCHDIAQALPGGNADDSNLFIANSNELTNMLSMANKDSFIHSFISADDCGDLSGLYRCMTD